MKRRLWVAAALAPLTFAAASQAAEPISSSTTTPVTESTQDVTINSGVSVAVTPATASTSGPTAVTQTGAHGVTNNGSVSSLETTSYSDTNGDGINDSNNGVVGQYAAGGNRYGVDIGNGVTGTSVDNALTGNITVIGENSAGIRVGANGLSGTLSNEGAISVTGGNLGTSDVSYGIQAIGAINGAVSLAGSVTATGANAQAVALEGGVTTGGVTVSGALTATGYRSVVAPTYTGYLSLLYQPTTPAHQQAAAAELLQGGPALNIGGGVAGGINVTAADTTVTPNVGRGSIISYGSAPAVLIGGANALNIGAVAAATGHAAGYGFVVNGSIVGDGTYHGFDGTGVQIGGVNPLAVVDNAGGANQVGVGGSFGAVTIANGLYIGGAGSISGSAVTADVTNGGVTTPGSNSAIGLHIGSGATVPTIYIDQVSTTSGSTTTVTGGSLTANVSSNSPTGSPSATALKIDSGGVVNTLTNYGTISASITPLTTTALNGAQTIAGGTTGKATAIFDASGSLSQITNYRTISATITPADGSSLSANASTVAMDLSANTGGVTVTQLANPLSTASALITPSIVGDIKFGTGAATLDLEAGTDTGAVEFGSSAGNALTLKNGATLTGGVTTAPGGMINLTLLNGVMTNTADSASTTYVAGKSGGLALSALSIGATSSLVLTVNPQDVSTGPLMTLSGVGNIADGAGVGLAFQSKLTGPVNYTVIQSIGGGSLTYNAGAIDTSLNGLFPYLYSAAILPGTPNALVIHVDKKTTQQLGFNPGEASAYNAIYDAFSNDAAVQTALLSKTNRASFVKLYDQFLPDYAGGPFESLVSGQQAVERTQAEEPQKLQSDEGRGWVEEITFVNHHDNSAGGGYDGAGFGLVAGAEAVRGDSAFGVTAAFLSTNIQDAAQTNLGALAATAVEGGAYWRAYSDGLTLSANVNGGLAYFDSRRLVYDASQTPVLYREASAHWGGALVAGSLMASYQFEMGSRFYVRPELAADYMALFEAAHTESGGAASTGHDAVDLAVNARTSTQATARADLVFGASFGTTIRWRPELTVGWRDVVSGGPGVTTAHFVGGAGTPFSLSPNFQDKGGILARLGLRAGGSYADFSADAGGQFRNSYQTYDARAVARFLF